MPTVRHPRTRGPARAAGFTLLELLVGVGLASLLLTALTSLTVMVSRQTTHVRKAPGNELENAMGHIADALRTAWLVQQPATDEVLAVDPYGNVTSFALEDERLLVRRPDDRAGVLLAEVEDFDVSVETVARLREAAPLDVYGPWFAGGAPEGEAEVVVVEAGLPLGLGFTLSSLAPEEHGTVDGVREQTLLGTLETLQLALAYLPDVGSPPEAGGGEGNGNGNGKGNGNGNGGDGNSSGNGNSSGDGGGNGDGKVTICHVPPGNPSAAHTLAVGAPAVAAHLAHGDTLGPCDDGGGGDDPESVQATVVISLHEARSHDDGRPHGPPLASLVLPAASLPPGSFTWTLVVGEGGDDEQGADGDGSGKVTICHIPPGNPARAHTIRVGGPAVPAHLAHGDVLGACDLGGAATWAVSIAPPTTNVTLDLAALGAAIEPARAYTLVLDLQGPGSLLLRGVEVGSPYDGAVAQKSWAGGGFEPLDVAVARTLGGMRRVTQTERHRVPSLVRLSIELRDGRLLATSTAVANQPAIPNPWYGTVPGEFPELQLDGD